MTPIHHRWLLELGTGTQVVRFPTGVCLCVFKTKGEKESVVVMTPDLYHTSDHLIS